MNKRSIIAGIVIAAALVSPFAASALSVDDLQQQIKDLLGRIATLQAQIHVQTDATSSPSQASSASTPRYCAILLNRNLSRGQRGDDVRAVQEFLSTSGYLNASATGFFGSATANAVAKWQSSEGVQAVGTIGPRSLEKLKIRCGTTTSNPYGFSVSPTSGTAPLTVTAYANVGGFINYTYAIDFGDGSTANDVRCQAFADVCRTPGSVTHTYAQNGTYTVVLYQNGGANSEHTAIARDVVTVGDSGTTQSGTLTAEPQSGNAPLPVSFTYHPTADQSGQYWIEFGDGNGQIMDTHQIYCFRAPCISPVVASHTYTSSGTYNVFVERYIGCQHTNPRCMIATMPLAQTIVTVNGSSSATQPSISGFSGPTSLAVNQSGTWSINASDPLNGTLNYSITWGDEKMYANAGMMASQATVVQQTTFTHSYASAGTYTVTITVRNASGGTAQSSATVQVGQGTSVCTAQYEPVCGRPNSCVNTCSGNQACPATCQLPSPTTYSNRCTMNNANATFMHDGVCTGNEGYLQ